MSTDIHLSKEEKEILDKKKLHNWEGYHDGPCCPPCQSEQELGYSGGGYFCCCHDGETALENNDYQPEHPPINGKVPDIFHEWGPETQGRYLKRYWNVIGPPYKTCMVTGHMQRPCNNENCLMRDFTNETIKALMQVD